MDKPTVPFWEIIPTFFLIPLKGVGMVALLLFSSVVTLLPSLLVFLLVLFSVIKYGMEILHNTAEGHLVAPALNAKVLNQNYELPFKLLLLLLLPLVILWEIGDGHPFLSFVVISFYSIAFPASIMTLAYTRHLLSAANPLELISLISRLGFSYIILYLFLFLLSGAAPAAYLLFIGSIVDSSFFFAVLFQVYFFWVMFAMMGYVLYQYHETIGYELPSERVLRKKIKQDSLTDFNTFVAAEDFVAAQRELKVQIQRNPDDLILRDKFHKLVKISGDNKELINQGAGMIGRLVTVNKLYDAVHVYLDCLKVEPTFKPLNEADYIPLAEEMNRMNLHKEAVFLSNGFHKTYAESACTPILYLLITKIFVDNLSQYDRARTLISFLKLHYPGHEIEADLERYTALLMKV